MHSIFSSTWHRLYVPLLERGKRCSCRQDLESTDQLLDPAFPHIRPPALANTFVFMILCFAIWEMMARSDQWFSVCALKSCNGFRVAIRGPPCGEDRLCFDLIFVLEFAQRFKKIQASENNCIKWSLRFILSLYGMYPHSYSSHFMKLKKQPDFDYCICLGV